MPVWPKIVYTSNVSLRAAATRWKLRQVDRAPAQQEQALGALTRRLAATSYWKEAGVKAGMGYADFRARVPVHTYERLAPAIEQMTQGASDVLWPGSCSLFGLTSGTSTGQPRCLPMTNDLLVHFRRAGFEALLYYAARTRRTGVFRGRHLFYGGTTALVPLKDGNPPAAFAAPVSGIAALSFPRWAERHFYEPGAGIAQLPGWETQVDAIARRARPCDITLIAGVPHGVSLLADAMRSKYFAAARPQAHLKEQWPNLECYIHSGAMLGPHSAALRRSLGPNVAFHEIYAASEGLIAAQDLPDRQGLRLMADAGVFFEFVPLSDYDNLRIEQLGPKAVPVAEVKTGIDYVVLLTTPAGLARYVIGDVVRFTSTTPPRINYVGGTELRLNAFAENVAEKELTETLLSLCQRRDWSLVNFHVAPLFAATNRTGLQRGSHEWWIELRPGTVVTPTGPQMAADLDAELQRTSASYAARRSGGTLEAPTVRLVMPGVFEHWLRFHQKWGGQNKMPRCRSDRLVADEFAQMTNFARD